MAETYGLLTIVPEDKLRRLLRRMLDPNEFLGDYGIRSISKAHEQPYVFTVAGRSFDIQYRPAESNTGMFGGNSNWRGPIWFPINFLLVEGLRRLYRYYGDDFRVEFPTGSGQEATLAEIADDLARRLISIFLPRSGRPPAGLRRRGDLSRPTPTGATTSSSTSTSTATTAPGSAPATKPAGPPSSPVSSISSGATGWRDRR